MLSSMVSPQIPLDGPLAVLAAATRGIIPLHLDLDLVSVQFELLVQLLNEFQVIRRQIAKCLG